MATTTKSKKSSVKTKTTKKPVKTAAAKTTKKVTPAKKTTAKAPAKKAAVKKTDNKAASSAAKTATKKVEKAAVKVSKPVKVPRVLTAAVLRKWHVASAVVFAALAVATVFVANASTLGVTLSYVTKDALASTSQTVLAPAAHRFIDVDVRWALVTVLGVSALFSLIRATKLKAKEEQGVGAQVLPARWLDLAVTFGGMTGLVALLAGFQDSTSVKLLGLMVVLSYYFAWLAERATAKADSQAKLFGVSGVVAAAIAWLFIASAFVATYVYGEASNNWYVYAAAATLFVGQLLIAKNQKRVSKQSRYVYIERDYIVLNLLTKLIFAGVLIAGLAQ